MFILMYIYYLVLESLKKKLIKNDPRKPVKTIIKNTNTLILSFMTFYSILIF